MIDCIAGFYEECECLSLMLISIYKEIKKYGGKIWIISDNTFSSRGHSFLKCIKNSLTNAKVIHTILEGDVQIGRDCLVFEWALKNLILTNPYILFCHSDIELKKPSELKKALKVCQQDANVIGSVILDNGGWVKNYDKPMEMPLLFSPRIAPWFSLFKRESWFSNGFSWANNKGSIFINGIGGIEDTGAKLLSSFLLKSPSFKLFYFEPTVVFHWRGMSANHKRIDSNLVSDSILGNQSIESYRKQFEKKLSDIRAKLYSANIDKISEELKPIIKVACDG